MPIQRTNNLDITDKIKLSMWQSQRVMQEMIKQALQGCFPFPELQGWSKTLYDHIGYTSLRHQNRGIKKKVLYTKREENPLTNTIKLLTFSSTLKAQLFGVLARTSTSPSFCIVHLSVWHMRSVHCGPLKTGFRSAG